MSELTTEQVKELKNMGALGYKPTKIAIIMGLDLAWVKEQYSKKDSNFYKIYKSGMEMSDYLIDLKLLDMAQAGDIKAIEKLADRGK